MMCIAPIAIALTGPADDCVHLAFDVAGRYALTLPDNGVNRDLTLQRARLEFAATRDGGHARVALMPVRTGGGSGAIGINGEALVYTLQVAEAGYTRGPVTLAAGLVDDPWAISSNATWGGQTFAPGFGVMNGWTVRSDLGAVVAFHQEWLAASVTWTTGEGVDRPERNDGKTLSGLVTAHLPKVPLSVTLYGSEGSVGLSSARNHRAGGRLHGETPHLRYGAETTLAWGVGGVGSRTPRAASGWIAAGQELPLVALVRVDAWREEPGATDSDGLRAMAWVGPKMGPTSLTLGVQHTRLDELARPLAGVGALESSTMVGVQLSSTGAFPLL